MKISRRPLSFAAAGVLVLASIVTAGIMLSGNIFKAHAASTFPSEYFAPYQDVTIGPSLQSVTQSTGQKYYTLAFITGNGCNAEWAGTIPLNQTSTYLPHLDSDISYIRNQGGDVIISFGGEAGQELAQTCSDSTSLQAQYQAVINQYHVTHLDFDIEGGEQGDSTTYDRRNIALAALQAANPGLVISFTLPSATTGLLSDSLGLLNNAVSHGVTFSVVNLMAMDYGSPDSQMGQEAINAANGLYSELQNIFPSKSSSQLWSMVGITPMIGQNDSAGEIFSLSDAQQVLSFAQQNHIGELAFWEVSRDNGSCAGSTTASDTCSGLSQSDYAFTDTFEPFTTGSSSGGSTPTPTPTSGGSTPTPTPTPGSGGSCAGVAAWSSTAVYVAGDQVTYNGSLWQAKWWTQGDIPGGSAGVWELLGSCDGSTTPTPTPTQASTPTPTPTQASTPTPTPTQSGNLVTNPGFETGNLSGWSCDSNDSVVTSPVHSGSYTLQVTPTSSTTGECDQTITVQANHTYTLSAYVDGPYAYLGVSGGSSNWTSSGSYTQLSVTFTTGSAQTSITIYIHGWYAEGNVYADDFSLS